MDRMKTFGLYALCIMLFFIFSNVMINIAIKSTYNPISMDVILEDNLKINIDEIKATAVNGYVKGSVKNTGDEINKTYVKIDLYSKRDVLLGTKYVEMDYVRANETRNFDIGFKLDNVNYAKISMVDEVDENVTEDNFKSEYMSGAALIAAVILLCYFG